MLWKNGSLKSYSKLHPLMKTMPYGWKLQENLVDPKLRLHVSCHAQVKYELFYTYYCVYVCLRFRVGSWSPIPHYLKNRLRTALRYDFLFLLLAGGSKNEKNTCVWHPLLTQCGILLVWTGKNVLIPTK